jgi:hypothetical protein
MTNGESGQDNDVEQLVKVGTQVGVNNEQQLQGITECEVDDAQVPPTRR